MSVEPKVPGFQPGEYVRDQFDERFLRVCPLTKDAGGAEGHLRRLEESGLAVVLPREELVKGGFARALAKAISLGIPVLTPYEDHDVRSEAVPLGYAAKHDEGITSTGFNYLEWKRQQLAKEGQPGNRLVSDPGLMGR